MPLDQYMRNAISKASGLPKAKKNTLDLSEMYEEEREIGTRGPQVTWNLQEKVYKKNKFRLDYIERKNDTIRRRKAL